MRGVPLSWELVVASIYVKDLPMGSTVVWSPCSKFIAVGAEESVEVLDAATLNRLATFKCPLPSNLFHLGFSPDSRSLMLLYMDGGFITWDLQTGGRLSEIRGWFPSQEFVQSSTHSKDGKVVAASYQHIDSFECKFYTFDLPSRTHLGPLPVPDGKLICPIWTHDEYLRFATIHPGSITIWEVEFTLKHPPTQVESFPIPDEVVHGRGFLFLPVLYRLAFTLEDTIQVLDVKTSKLLFEVKQRFEYPPACSFSYDGHFFAFATATDEIHVWKESPVGYVLHKKSTPPLLNNLPWLHLSPNGRSIVFPLDGTINLWHTRDQIPSPPASPNEERSADHFILTFSPDEKSAAFAHFCGKVVTILDLKSGNSRLTIDTGMKVECLGVAEDTVIVVDQERIVTWNLPGGDRAFNAGINDSVRSVILDRSLSEGFTQTLSPHLNFFAVTRSLESGYTLEIYDVHTGTRIASITPSWLDLLSFTQDGREIWTWDDLEYVGWEIIKDDESGGMELKPLEETSRPSGMPPWQSHHGYEVTDDGWVLSPTRKRLLWLPHRWREDRKECKLWSRRFLGLSHRLSEVVILEFLE